VRFVRAAVAVGLVGVGVSLYLSRRDSGKRKVSKRTMKMIRKLGKSAIKVGGAGKKAVMAGASSLQGLHWH
jgi:hypothetical protein